MSPLLVVKKRIFFFCFPPLHRLAACSVLAAAALVAGCNSQPAAQPATANQPDQETKTEVAAVPSFQPPLKQGDKVPAIEAAGWINARPRPAAGEIVVIDLWGKW